MQRRNWSCWWNNCDERVGGCILLHYIDLWGPIGARRRKQFSRLHTKSITRRDMIFCGLPGAQQVSAIFGARRRPPLLGTPARCIVWASEREMDEINYQFWRRRSRWKNPDQGQIGTRTNQSGIKGVGGILFSLYIYTHSESRIWLEQIPPRPIPQKPLDDPPDAATAIKPSHCLESTLSK